MSSSNRFKSLVSNTLLFALGTFGSKLLVYFLYPIYTQYLTPEQLGTFGLVVDICNFLTPIIYLSMNEAMIRFGADPLIKKEDVYTSGLLITFLGFGIFLALRPIFVRILLSIDSLTFATQYLNLIYIYVLASALRALAGNYVRSQGHVKLFAIDGIITILTNAGLTLSFIALLKWGVTGYLLAVILSDFLSALLLTVASKSYTHFQLKGLDLSVAKDMVRYSLPLTPAALFWWVTNFSNRFVINYYVGLSAVGVFDAANKLPQLLIMISTVFIQAWQLSAFTETDSKAGKQFFSDIFRSYYALLFLVASGVIIISKPFASLLSEKFFESWQYAPFLVLASTFSCLVTFLGTIYNVHKKNAMVTITTAIGAVINIALNILLLPKIGLQGAAFSTFISYLTVFLIRSIDTRRYIHITMRVHRIFMSLGLLLGQIFVYLKSPRFSIPLQFLFLLGIFFINNAQFFDLWDMAKEAFDAFLQERKEKNKQPQE